MPSEKIQFQMDVENAIKHLSEKCGMAINLSPFTALEIAERMNMGDLAIVERVIKSGSSKPMVEYMQVGTLLRLIHAAGFEMHVKFVPQEKVGE